MHTIHLDGSARVFGVFEIESDALVLLVAFTGDELEMPGYVESWMKGYDGTTWRVEEVEL